MKFAFAEPETAGIAFMEGDLQVALPGALTGEPDQVARAVEPGNMRKAAARKLPRMPAFSAEQHEKTVVLCKSVAPDEKIDFLFCVAAVLVDFAVGLV